MSIKNSWSAHYCAQTQRNLGILDEQQQQRLKDSRIAVMGLGGIGGPCFEVLVRTGIEKFSIVDRDRYDQTNINRQNFAFLSTAGKAKTQVACDFAKDINPGVEIDAFNTVDERNADEVIAGADAVVMGIDELRPCILVSRKARALNIPVIEGWALPYGNVRVFTSQSPSLEESYGLPTVGRELPDIPKEEMDAMGRELLMKLGTIEGIAGHYKPDAADRIAAGRIPSFAPMVWFTSVMMAIETVKVLLGWGKPALGPQFSMYDPFEHIAR